MPLSKHYRGHGEEVMRDMTARYGAERGERVFYATENKRKKKKSNSHPRGRGGMAVGMQRY